MLANWEVLWGHIPNEQLAGLAYQGLIGIAVVFLCLAKGFGCSHLQFLARP